MSVCLELLWLILIVSGRLKDVQSKMNWVRVISRLWSFGGKDRKVWFGSTDKRIFSSSGKSLSLTSDVPVHSVSMCSIVSVSAGAVWGDSELEQILQEGSTSPFLSKYSSWFIFQTLLGSHNIIKVGNPPLCIIGVENILSLPVPRWAILVIVS